MLQLSLLACQQCEQVASLTQHAQERRWCVDRRACTAPTAQKKTHEQAIAVDAVGDDNGRSAPSAAHGPRQRVRLPLYEDIRSRHEMEADPVRKRLAPRH
jgi:hypothetical protein